MKTLQEKIQPLSDRHGAFIPNLNITYDKSDATRVIAYLNGFKVGTIKINPDSSCEISYCEPFGKPDTTVWADTKNVAHKFIRIACSKYVLGCLTL